MLDLQARNEGVTPQAAARGRRPVAVAAVRKIVDQRLLGQIATERIILSYSESEAERRHTAVREAAFETITEESVLLEIARAQRSMESVRRLSVPTLVDLARGRSKLNSYAVDVLTDEAALADIAINGADR